MRIFVWILKIIPVLVIGALIQFYLPFKNVVRIVDTDVKRMDVVSKDFINETDPQTRSQMTRDVRFINTTWPDGTPRVFRNEETGWGFPWYFKFDSGNIQTVAQDLRSNKADPTWVVITYYGWRIELFSMFPNAVNIVQVESPNVTPIPWFSLVFVTLLLGFLIYLWVLWRRFLERLAFDERFENASNSFQQIGRWARANWRERSGRLRDWLDTWKPKNKR